MKNNGDIVSFLRGKNYIMLNNDLGRGSFGETVLLQDPYIDEIFVAKNMNLMLIPKRKRKDFIKTFLMK